MIALLLSLLACQSTVTLDDTAPTTDTQDTAPDPDPIPDMSQYTAALSWTYDSLYDEWDCADDTVETGVEITDAATLSGLQKACALCDHFYEATQDHEPCEGNLGAPDPDYRGVVLGNGVAQIYRFDYRDGNYSATMLDDDAVYDEWSISMSTTPIDGWLSGELTVVGTWEFPETYPEE